MSGQLVVWPIPSVGMTEDELAEQRRRGYYLRIAREWRGATLAAAAEAAGLADSSGSSVSLWERGERPIPLVRLKRLADYYQVPLAFLMTPEQTDLERLQAAVLEASELERAEREQAPEPRREAAAKPAAARRTRSA